MRGEDGPALPPELILNVFEHSDRTTLINCSYVSRVWHDMSMPYRFYEVVLRCDSQDKLGSSEVAGQEAEETTQESRQVVVGETMPSSGKSLHTFLSFLRNVPGVAQSIRALSIDLNPRMRVRGLQYSDRMEFLETLRLLPNLSTLTLNNLFLQNWRSEPVVEAKLDTLTIRYPGFYAGAAGEIETIELLGIHVAANIGSILFVA